MTVVFAMMSRLLNVVLQAETIDNTAWLLGVLALILVAGLAARLVTVTARHQQTAQALTHALADIRTLEQTAQARLASDQARQASEAQFRLFLDHLSDVAIILNPDSTIRYVSPSVQRILNDAPDLIGKKPWELLHPDMPQLADGSLVAGFTQLVEHPSPLTPPPYRLVRPDGSVCWIEATINVQLDNPQINGIFIVARDITERVQVEQVLRESENRFRTIADSAPMLIWVAEPDGQNSFNNKWMMEFTGLPQEKLAGTQWRQHLHPDDVAGFEATDHQVLQAHQPFTHEYRLRRADGQYRWMLDIGIPRFSPDGSYLGFIGTVVDIHERKVAEATLREREAQYRSIFESVSDGLEISDPVTRQVVDVNPAMCAMHGYTREEYLSLPNNTFVAPGNPYFIGQYLDEFSRTNERTPAGPFIGRSVNVHKDGHQFDVQVAVKSFYQNGKLRLLTVVRDITEQVTVTQVLEQAVRERTNHLRQLLDVSQAISSTLDLNSLMQLILDRLHTVVPYTTASIALIDPPGRLMIVKRAGQQSDELSDLEWAYKPEDHHFNQILNACQPVNIKDVQDVKDLGEGAAPDPYAKALRASLIRLLGHMPEQVRSWLGIPMVSEGQAIGLLILEAGTPNAYDEQAIERITPFANHTATAIENSRLKDTAMQSATRAGTIAERTRIARELHDSVSQALFGIVLGARTAKEQSERVLAQQARENRAGTPGPPGTTDTVTRDAIDYTLNLAEGALAEMRTLIFELRPETLTQEGLIVALRKQAVVLMARQKIEVEAVLDHEPNLPVSSKEALYRIAVEALQNIVKHSGATQVKLILKQQPLLAQARSAEPASLQSAETTGPDEIVVLSIIDNGRGFDPNAFYPGHLGLHSMRERAEEIKGKLDMDSSPGGTRITLTVPIQPTRSGLASTASRQTAASIKMMSGEMDMA